MGAIADRSEEDLDAEITETTITVEETTTTTVEETTTTVEETTTTIEETTTTVEETTTTVSLTLEDVHRIYAGVFEGQRDDLLEIIEEVPVIETVDVFIYDQVSNEMVLDVTPRFDFDSGVRDDAWLLTRLLSNLWQFSGLQQLEQVEQLGWSGPELRVTVSNAEYFCPAQTMNDLRETRLSRTQWEEICRVR